MSEGHLVRLGFDGLLVVHGGESAQRDPPYRQLAPERESTVISLPAFSSSDEITRVKSFLLGAKMYRDPLLLPDTF